CSHFAKQAESTKKIDLLTMALCFSFGGLARRDVEHIREHEKSARGRNRIQADLDREFATVLAPGEKLPTGSHRPGLRICLELRAVSRMHRDIAVGDKNLHWHADQLIAVVAKKFLDMRVHQDDLAIRVN